MDSNAIRQAPWRLIAATEFKDAVGYTFAEERQVSAWLARDYYCGEGEIVDAGAFFGSSALTLCVGLRLNKAVPEMDKTGRIHSYDNFLWAPWISEKYRSKNVVDGTSFMNKFHDTILKYDSYVVVHPGDVERQAWRCGPVGVLLVDCAKSFAANSALMRMFFPHLIPGYSIVNQQDYAIASRLIWLHASMEYFADRFEELGSTASGGTTLFRLTKEITSSEVEACIAALSKHSLDLARSAIRRYGPDDRRRIAIEKSIAGFNEAPLALC